MPEFEIHADELTWDFGMMRSDYAEHRAAGVMANGGATWLAETVLHQPTSLFDGVVAKAIAAPAASGYGGDPAAEAQADIDAAIGGLDPAAIMVSRLFAMLPKAALATDLTLGASPTQVQVHRDLYLTKSVGDGCVGIGTASDCYSGSSTGGSNQAGGSGGSGGAGASGASGSGCGACAVGEPSDALAVIGLAAAALGVGAASARRRVRRRGASRSSLG